MDETARLRDTDDDGSFLHRLEPGDEIGGYLVDTFVAEGGFSDVYRAHRCDHVAQTVAIKTVPLPLAGRLREALAIGAHPHLVEVLGVGKDDDRNLAYAVMRFVSGRSLAEILAGLSSRGCRLSARERRHLVERFAEIADALSCLHGRGYVHRDVKPANIMIALPTSDAELSGSATLVDLGLMQPVGSPSPASTIFATLPYAAPEQLLGLEVDGRGDVFSLGVSMHDLFAARTPERRRRRPAAGLERLDEIAPEVDPALSAIIAEAVAPDLALRYASAAALHADLLAWLADAPVSVMPQRPWRRLVRALHRQPRHTVRRLLHTTMLLGALAVAVILITSWAKHQEAIASCDTAWSDGDLEAVVAIEAGMTWPWRVVAPAPARAHEGATAAVLAILRAADREGAILHAARLLSRDGIVVQSVIGAWFSHLLAADQSDVGRICRLLSRAFYDSPVIIEDPISRRLGGRLLEIAMKSRDETALHALATAGGVLATTSLPQLIAVLQTQAREHPNPREVQRLVLDNLSRIAARAVANSSAADQVAAVEGALAVVLDGDGAWPSDTDHRHPAQPALEDCFATLRRLRDAAGMPPPDWRRFHLPRPPTPPILALSMDQAFTQRVRQGRYEPADGIDGDALGFALGVLGASESEITTASERFLLAADGNGRAQLNSGLARGRRALQGKDSRWLPDPGSRLADELEPPRSAVDLPTIRLARADGFAVWNLLTNPIQCEGGAGAVEGSCVQVGADEVATDLLYVWMGSPGRSRLRMDLAAFSDRTPPTVLTISAQKGQRGSMPYGGEAGLDVLIDGVLIASILDVGIENRSIPFKVDRINVGRGTRIELRLRADATTTLRLFAVRLD